MILYEFRLSFVDMDSRFAETEFIGSLEEFRRKYESYSNMGTFIGSIMYREHKSNSAREGILSRLIRGSASGRDAWRKTNPEELISGVAIATLSA